MYPITFKFDIAAFDAVRYNIPGRKDWVFALIRPVDGYGYFYIKQGWIPKCCYAPETHEYSESRIDKDFILIKKEPCIWSDIDYDLASVYSPSAPSPYSSNPCLILDEFEDFYRVDFDVPIIAAQIWVPIADLLFHDKNTLLVEYYVS